MLSQVFGELDENKVDLSAHSLKEIDGQVRRIIQEEVPPMIEKALKELKFNIQIPIKID